MQNFETQDCDSIIELAAIPDWIAYLSCEHRLPARSGCSPDKENPA
jgi:hypothetical protein